MGFDLVAEGVGIFLFFGEIQQAFVLLQMQALHKRNDKGIEKAVIFFVIIELFFEFDKGIEIFKNVVFDHAKPK
ncbi:Hypothetical protein AJF4211_000140 [Avibacterium paragallinarum JF4211]|nr:Hypothetical protein AJF4211_000140 [Avibacterium paragallinarum JF4211]